MLHIFVDAAGPFPWRRGVKTSSCVLPSWRWLFLLRLSGPCFSSPSYTSHSSVLRSFSSACASDVTKESGHRLRVSVTAACVLLHSEAPRDQRSRWTDIHSHVLICWKWGQNIAQCYPVLTQIQKKTRVLILNMMRRNNHDDDPAPTRDPKTFWGLAIICLFKAQGCYTKGLWKDLQPSLLIKSSLFNVK